MTEKNVYRLDEVYKNRIAIFAPSDICAMAVVDAYIGSKEKAEALVAKANLSDILLAALKDIAEYTDPEPPEMNYRGDDREGCFDAVFATARAAIAKASAAESEGA